MSAAEQRSRAQVIFDGIVLDGPTATGVQRFRVTRYVKGTGPKVVRVSTGNVKRADGTGLVTSVSIVAKRGEHWRIFARGKPQNVLVTTVCDGSVYYPGSQVRAPAAAASGRQGIRRVLSTAIDWQTDRRFRFSALSQAAVAML